MSMNNIIAEKSKIVLDKTGVKPVTEWDMRKVFDDKEINAVSFAIPNHWHALATIWACQAGKHVYVEKPACHNIFEGRKMIEASRKYNVTGSDRISEPFNTQCDGCNEIPARWRYRLCLYGQRDVL